MKFIDRMMGKQAMSMAKRGKALGSGNSSLSYKDFLQFMKSDPELAHSYETLLSSLHLLNSTRPLKTLLITSTQPEEGKTTVAINLALAMTLAGKKALVLEADLRKPKIHQILKLDNTLGLVDILTGTLEARDAIQAIEVSHDTSREKLTLSAIPSGRVSANSFNAIGSPRLREAIGVCATMYDFVLVDSPPVLSVSDPLLMAPMVDGIILVLNTGVVTEKDAQRVKERLEQAGGLILGVVMNRFDEKQHGPGFHPYKSYYYRGAT